MDKYLKSEKVFLIFSILIGLFMVFFVPPFQSQDEPNHFKRAYSVAVFKNFSVQNDSKLGNFLPCAIQDFINSASDSGKEVIYGHSSYRYSLNEVKKLFKYKINKNEQCFLTYPNMAIYSPFAYLPQSLGIFSMSLFSAKILLLFLTGRVFNLILYTILCFYAIKSTPFLKWAFVILLSSPMCIALAASLSADAVLIGFCSIFLAKVLQYSFNEQQYLSKKQLLLLSVLALMIAMIKQSFFFLLFIFLIPVSKFKRNYIFTIALILIPAVIFSGMWSLYASSIMVSLNNSDAASHIIYIIHHPLNYLVLQIKTLFNLEVLYQLIGVLGWKNLYLSNFYYLIFLIVLFCNIFCCTKNKIKFDKTQKLVICFSVILNILVIQTLTFLYWTYKTNFSYIELQGRYLLPFVLPVCFLINSCINTTKENHYIKTVNLLFLCVSGIYLIFTVLRGYY